MTYKSVNPNSGEILKTFEEVSYIQLEESLVNAESCYATWKNKSYKERAVIVAKAAELMHSHVDDFAKLATLEMGKRIDEANF